MNGVVRRLQERPAVAETPPAKNPIARAERQRGLSRHQHGRRCIKVTPSRHRWLRFHDRRLPRVTFTGDVVKQASQAAVDCCGAARRPSPRVWATASRSLRGFRHGSIAFNTAWTNQGTHQGWAGTVQDQRGHTDGCGHAGARHRPRLEGWRVRLARLPTGGVSSYWRHLRLLRSYSDELNSCRCGH